MTGLRWVPIVALTVTTLAPVGARAATHMVVVNLDAGSGQGLDDPTPRDPVGGNAGTTLGEQRLIALEHAANLWGEALSSGVEIRIAASFTALPCSATSAVLGSAGPAATASFVRGDIDATAAPIEHPIALANALQGRDLAPDLDDIAAEFNSAIDDGNTCLEHEWYYGLDGQAENDADFLAVALHELGHGLGFTTFVDHETGESAAPDVFSVFAFDRSQGKAWHAMTASERLASQTNPRGLVWSGPNVLREASRLLVAGAPMITLNPALAGLDGRLSEQTDGPKLSDEEVAGTLVQPEPLTGCQPPTNASELEGQVVLVDPAANCDPVTAVVFMQQAGAAGVVVVDPSGSDPPEPLRTLSASQQIPAIVVTAADGARLASDAIGRTITLAADMSRLVGADEEGRPFLYASNPFVAGSSVSHWDPLARPDLLMEPDVSPGVATVDLTRYMLKDIGWPICGDAELQSDEECDDGNIEDGDGCSSRCEAGVCGDGALDPATETCDDGNVEDGDGCSAACESELCGDGATDDGEQCDDGNTTSGDGCDEDCRVERCGDGALDADDGEECDDGNRISGDGCDENCRIEEGAPSSTDSSGCGCGIASTTATPLALLPLAVAFGRRRRRVERRAEG